MAVQFFYDNQIRRFLLQFIRIMSNFQVEFGTRDTNTGALALQTVPVFYGDQSRQAAQILRGGSENAMSSVPAMAVYISQFTYDRDRVQEPFHVSKMSIRQRMIDTTTGMPTSDEGDSFTIERIMPVPYKLTLKTDIWTSNTDQKLQLIEQLATLFNPSMEIQSTDNYIDWTSLSAVLLTDISWDSRTVPTGTDEAISVATMTFELPIWISPPAKVKKLGVIQKVISNMWDDSGMLSGDAIGDPNLILTRRAWNILRYGVTLQGNILRLAKYNEAFEEDLADPFLHITNTESTQWRSLLEVYGNFQNGISEMRLAQPDGTEVVGTFAYHPSDPTAMLFSPFVDTLPGNTMPPINAIIDPFKANVDDLLIDKNTNAYKVAAGTRFLILNDINEIHNTDWAAAWSPNGQHFSAHANDIIAYDGTKWGVVFDSRTHLDNQYVTNLNTNVQYRWTGEGWVKSYEGVYREGTWTLIL